MNFQSLVPKDFNDAILKAKEAVAAAKAKALNLSEIEVKVRNATNNDPWGASGTLMSEIAQATFNFNEFSQVFPQIWLRLEDTKMWRHVYKALALLEYLIVNGSERCAEEARNRKYDLRAFLDYQFVDENGVNRGKDVVAKTKKIIELLDEPDQLAFERDKAKQNRGKYQGISSDHKYSGFGSNSSSSSSSSGHGGYSGSGSGGDSGGFSSDDYYSGKIAGSSSNYPRRPSFEDTDSKPKEYITAPITPLFDDTPAASPVVAGKNINNASKPAAVTVNLLDLDVPASQPQQKQQQTFDLFAAAPQPAKPAVNNYNSNNFDPFGFNATSTTTPAAQTNSSNNFAFANFNSAPPANSTTSFNNHNNSNTFGNFQSIPAYNSTTNSNNTFGNFQSAPVNNNNNNNNIKPNTTTTTATASVGKGSLADMPLAGLVDLVSLGTASSSTNTTQSKPQGPPTNVPLNQIKSDQSNTGKVQRTGGIGSVGPTSSSLNQQQQQQQFNSQQSTIGGIPNFLPTYNNNNNNNNNNANNNKNNLF